MEYIQRWVILSFLNQFNIEKRISLICKKGILLIQMIFNMVEELLGCFIIFFLCDINEELLFIYYFNMSRQR